MLNRIINIGCIISGIIFILSCSKDKDNIKPTIAVHSPVYMQQINGNDTLHILASVSDNRNIEWVRVTLKNSDGVPVLSTVSKNPNTKEYEFNVSYFFNDIHLTSDQYYFAFKASDGENISSAYVDILFDETPRVRNGIFVFSNNGNVTDFTVLDSNYNGTYYNAVNGDFLGAEVNSYDQQLIHASGISGSISAIDLSSGSVAWSEPIISSPPTIYYTSFSYESGLAYLGKWNETIYSYDKNGNSNYITNTTSGFYLMATKVHEDKYLVTVQHSISGNNVNLVLYWMASGVFAQQYSLNEEVIGIYSYNSEIILITNDASANGKIDFYNTSVGQSSSPFTINVGYIDDCIEVDNGVYLIVNNGDITLINVNNYSTLPYLTGIAANKIKYDFLTNELMVISGNTLSIYDFNSKSLKGTYNHSSNILDVAFWYNK